MNVRTILLALCMLLVGLAGCAESAPAPEEDDTFDGLVDEDNQRDDLGVIRGVVVDNAIVPIADALVTLLGDKEQTATTTQNGAFAFQNLEPGFTEIVVDKKGYAAARLQVNVVAGEKQPAVVQVQLTPDPSELPFIQPLVFNGYLDCSFSSPAYRIAACGVANPGGLMRDNFMTTYEGLGPAPDFIQSEMVWESTQPAGDAMMFTLEADVSDGGEIGDDAQGVSPLVIKADALQINESRYAGSLIQRVFNFEYPGTAPPVPVCGIPNPIHGGTMCAKGVGATIQQPFTIYTHVFFRTAPSDSWQFSNDGAPDQ